jgi:DNA-binding MarR family transcriptional regulator
MEYPMSCIDTPSALNTRLALRAARNAAERQALNSGQAGTLALIAAIQATDTNDWVERDVLYMVSSLSRSSVDSHVRRLEKGGLVGRYGDVVRFLVKYPRES